MRGKTIPDSNSTMPGKKPPLPAEILERARRLRHEATDVEGLLWRLLRGQQLGGYKFRRQVPLGKYFADFYCHAAHLVVEADGGGHNEERQREHDAEREAALRAMGIRILRFWDHDVLQKTDAVLLSIWEALGESPSP